MAVEHIRLSQHAKDQLLKLKRDTGIPHWNVLCRVALCISLSEPSIPPDADIPADSNVEMDWRTFGGDHAELYWALIVQRCHQDKLDTCMQVLSKYFRLHLHRGISYLATRNTVVTFNDLFADAQ
jgi:DNA sulfur modification protein DndE